MFSWDKAEGPVCAVIGPSASSLHGGRLCIVYCETGPVHHICLWSSVNIRA